MIADNHLHSIRVAYGNWLYDDRFEHLIKLLFEYRGGITDVALFTTATHSPLSPEEFSRRIDIIGSRLPALREAGFSAGINHLTTIGHHCEDLDAGLGDRYTFMTGIDGAVCRGSYCMRNPDFVREYVVPCYREMAQTHPDFIWIDDDIRYGHMDIDYHARVLCDCTCGIFENRLGGRVCVSGYYPHDWLSDIQKTVQLKQIFLWLSRGTLPAYIESYHRVRNITLGGEGHTCVTLFNTSNDDLQSLSVAIRCDSDSAVLYPMTGEPITLTADCVETHFGGTYRFFTVDRIRAFEGVILSV